MVPPVDSEFLEVTSIIEDPNSHERFGDEHLLPRHNPLPPEIRVNALKFAIGGKICYTIPEIAVLVTDFITLANNSDLASHENLPAEAVSIFLLIRQLYSFASHSLFLFHI